ncbi:hypothetical protein F4819DRAFT_442392 [Hypoxylon fuscum]|nr:hypothetical protein F4819DRAFT_442392 [Hypoxylon fuscum]
MKTSPLVGLGLFTSNVLTLDTRRDHAIVSPSIYVLRTSQPATNALGKALDTLGYNRLGSVLDSVDQIASSDTYIEISSSAQFLNVTRSFPEAQFILPSSKGNDGSSDMCAWSWVGGACHDWRSSDLLGEEDHVQLARTLFSEEERSQVFLELDVLALEKAAQAENWVELCKFLGMGYSMVERLKLWHFPQ